MFSLDEIIQKAIPYESCAIQEAYNKNRRTLLKQRLNAYIADQLSQQFNAKPFTTEDKPRLGSDGN